MQPGFINITGFNLYLNIKENLNFIHALAKFSNTMSIWFLKAERILDYYFRFLKCTTPAIQISFTVPSILNNRLDMSASPYIPLYCIFSNNSQNCIQKHLKHQIQCHTDKSSAAMNIQILLCSVTCIIVITITIYQGEKKTHPAKGNLSLPARTPIAHKLHPSANRADIHLPTAF